MLDFSGRTALVTGASAGIGRELARILARDVGTLIVVARRRDRLDQLALDLAIDHPALRVVVRDVDLNDRVATGAMLDALHRDGFTIDVLINNAGFGDTGPFERTAWTKIEQMLELNVVAATFLLHRLLPTMLGRRWGAVLNVGSVAGMIATPMTATYGATKAYFNHLSEAIRAEVADGGVVVTTLCPGPVPTEFQAVAGAGKRVEMPEFFTVDAVACAEQGIAGLKRGRARVVPGPLAAVVGPLEALPKVIVRPVLKRMARGMRGSR